MAALCLVGTALLSPVAGTAASSSLVAPGERHFENLRQLTFGGENAEAYWSPDGAELIFQSTREPFACDQIFRMSADGGGEEDRTLVSTGMGRTTCAYFLKDGERVLYSSTHREMESCPPPPDRSQGYVWPLYESFEIFTARPDGSDLVALTDNDHYDAEATVCPADGSMVFTSTRDGDLDLYRMDADGGSLQRLTDTPGYDGGAFFSRDCSRIVWRASRPREGEDLDEYRRLLERNLVRPGKLEIWVAEADGSNARQITYLDAASFAPYFFPEGDRVIFSSNYGDPRGREFDLWSVDVDGSGLERLTFSPGFDGFPMFSPDGRRLVFASNRNQGEPGETNVFVADWRGGSSASAHVETSADRFKADVGWLADDEREGRGIGTRGLAAAAGWLADRFRELGAEAAGAESGYLDPFEVTVSVTASSATSVALDGDEIPRDDFLVLPFSTPGTVAGEVVAAGYGISAEDLGVDDYAGLEVEGKVVAVRRFVPVAEPFADPAVERRYGDLRHKAFTAREQGAVALLVVDLPEIASGEELPDEAPFPRLKIDSNGDAGIPVLVLARSTGAALFEGGAQARRAKLSLDLEVETSKAQNVVGKIAAGAAGRLSGALVIGAHYDHLGMGSRSSLSPDAHEPHNGADDNASGVAALLEAGRRLAKRRGELRRDVYLVAFSAEESGLLGSTHLTRHPPDGLEIDNLFAMLNMDMVGRLRSNRLQILGGDSAGEWREMVPPFCRDLGLECTLGGDGYGPSDQTPFFAAGVPVLHFFTGIHGDYHKPSDDAGKINAAGGGRVAALVAEVASKLSGRGERLTLQPGSAPPATGDSRSFGASLGTIPDYAGDEKGGAGVLLAGVRPGSAAETAGIARGDILVALGGHEVRDIYDFVFVLRKSKPGETTIAVVERDGERLELEVTYGESRRR